MLVYKKENGFPMTLMIETGDHKEVLEDGEIWEGYESIVTDENQNIIDRFNHSDFRARVHWVKGFFAALKMNNPDLVNEWDKKDLWKGPEAPLIAEDGKSNMDVWDWIVRKDGKVQRITHDDDSDLPWEKIARFASRSEAKNAEKINELIQDLERLKASNLASWNTYGSELCAADMSKSEKVIEDKIKELRCLE